MLSSSGKANIIIILAPLHTGPHASGKPHRVCKASRSPPSTSAAHPARRVPETLSSEPAQSAPSIAKALAGLRARSVRRLNLLALAAVSARQKFLLPAAFAQWRAPTYSVLEIP